MIYSKKSLGQNFLINDKVLPTIIKTAEIKKNDFVIEVGPGRGILTQALIETGAKILAIEKDYDLSAKLQKTYKNKKNFKITHQDALLFDPDSIIGKYKVVANLPFNVASPIIRKFLESPNAPELMVLMVQKEVAQKILAPPGSSLRGILTLAVEFYAEAEFIENVSKVNFWPQPKVDAAILKIKPKSHFVSGSEVKPGLFFRIVKAGFASKRRQIHNSLAATLHLERKHILEILKKSEINPTLRAEDLNLKKWLKLCQIIAKDDILNINE